MYVYVETEILSSLGNSFVARNILRLSIVPISITLKSSSTILLGNFESLWWMACLC